MSKDLTITVEYDGLSLRAIIAGQTIDGAGEAIREAAGIEANYLVGKIMGPREGIRAFHCGDRVLRRNGGAHGTVMNVDRKADQIQVGEGWFHPDEWRPTWTIPDTTK